MRYVDYRDAIHAELRRNVAGLTWAQLQSRLDLPYDRPCPAWTKQLEHDIGLQRTKSNSRSLIWRVGRFGTIASPAAAVDVRAPRR